MLLKAQVLPKTTIYFILFFCLMGCKQEQAVTKVQESEAPTSQVNSMAKKVIEVAIDTQSLNYLMGKFSPEADSNFVLVPEDLADRGGMYIRKEALKAYKQMYADALKDGINLQIRSATRNFDYQKGIWERKWTGETKLSSGEDASIAFSDSKTRAREILNYSSMPGTSRHHWGTDIDLNNFNNEWFEEGEGEELFNWLESNAANYGYCRPYTRKNNVRPHGYNEEKWHWSYMPLSENLTSLAEQHLNNNMISGFQGSEVAGEIDVVKKYVLGVNHNCRSHK